MENKKVILKLICPICNSQVWEHTEHVGEFRCAECREVLPCEHMIVVSESIEE